MSEQDELQKVIFGYFGPTYAINAYRTAEQQDQELAAAIWDAGYRKPRTITTREELDTLPNMTVVRSSKGSIVNLTGGRACIFGTEGSAPASSLALPVTVLHDPASQP